MLIRIVLALSALGLVAMTSGCKHGGGDHSEWMTSMVAHKLDLNADQKAKLEDVRKAFDEARKADAAERDKNVAAVRAQLLGDKLDPVVVKGLMKAHQDQVDKNFDPIFTKVQTFHSSLSAKQKQEAVDMIDSMMKRFND